ncbi:MAG: hypothetical protein GWO19_10955 [Nitrospinaceae bacterium]|nr:hypothetical protein [Nitrospinaceae bacterium]NIR55035.1 hypothetical protein [Nitrospinaceae bacterium]NIS85434.1 hypothetical protein [Nitrospinaceae bacterium]NIT82273.1 hypothetical protein [Nitrospinaceae bacterium]NIU44503.1 hypothetical protein [Nitrospinaceae bacterium]
MKTHKCQAEGCGQRIDIKHFMCTRHWFMVPVTLRRVIKAGYRPGRVIDKLPSKVYDVAAVAALAIVKNNEAHR